MSKKKSREREEQASLSKQASANRNTRFLLFAALGITFVSMYPVLNNQFVNWDDIHYIIANPAVHDFSWETFKGWFDLKMLAIFPPLTMISFQLEYLGFELNPFVYHLDNLLLHLLNTALVFWMIRLLVKDLFPAFLVALLFGIHPMHVESVAWVTERKDVLFAAFYLGATVSYLYYRLREAGSKYYAIALGLMFLSLLSKPQAVTLPVLFLLLDYFMQRPPSTKLWMDKIPFFALSLISGLLTIYGSDLHAYEELAAFTYLDRIAFSIYGVMAYLYKLVLPWNQSCYYPYPEGLENSYPITFWLAPLGLAGLIYLVWKNMKEHRVIVFGAAFYLLHLGLVLHLIGINSSLIYERFTYLPYIGVFLIIGVYLPELAKKRFWLNYAAAGFVLMCCVLTYQRSQVWFDSVTLWTDVLEQYPKTARALYGRGFELAGQGRPDLALSDFNDALKYKPDYDKALAARGNAYQDLGQIDFALKDYNELIRKDTTDWRIYRNRGRAYHSKNRLNKALADFNKALEMKPDDAQNWANRAVINHVLDRLNLAMEDVGKALSLDPEDPFSYKTRGSIYYEKQAYDKAIADFTQAVRLKQDYGDAYLGRSFCWYVQRDYPNALRDALNAQQTGTPVDKEYMALLNRYAVVR